MDPEAGFVQVRLVGLVLVSDRLVYGISCTWRYNSTEEIAAGAAES